MNAADGSCEEFRYGEYGHVRQLFMVGQWDGISHHDFFNGRVFEPFERRAGEDAMRGAAVDIAGAAFVYDPDSLLEGPAGVHFVAQDQAISPVHRTHNPHAFRHPITSVPALLHQLYRP